MKAFNEILRAARELVERINAGQVKNCTMRPLDRENTFSFVAGYDFGYQEAVKDMAAEKQERITRAGTMDSQ